MTAHQLHWSHGEATVLTTAAMLAECRFMLPSGPFAPFARASWLGTVTDPGITGHLRVLGGDFVGLPFGIGREVREAPPDWAAVLTGPTAGPIHGPAADRDWAVVSVSAAQITLTLDYPATSPVLRLERVIAARPGQPALDFSFRIFARHKASISVGLHPILRLPDQPGRLRLSADFAFGLTHPGHGAREFTRLAAVPLGESTVDLSHAPLSPATDLNVQLCGMRGPLTAIYQDEGAGVELDWDRSLLPSLQIWHSDRGIGGAPWHHQYRGLGVEPIASAFDLDTGVSCGPNPISARGVATAIRIDPTATVTIRHSIRAFAT